MTHLWDAPPTHLPHNTEAEQALLGSVFYAPAAVATIDAILTGPTDFYDPRHQVIWRTMLDLHGRDRNPRIDPITVAEALLASGDLARVGGAPYLHELAQSVPVVSNADYYAGIVREHALRRAVLTAAHQTAQRALSGTGTAAEIAEAAMSDLQAATKTTSSRDEHLTVADRWMGFLDELETGQDPRALDTPWPDLNDVIELKPGQLITVGAATGGGKSIFGLNLAAHVALTRGRPAFAASLEMGGSELMARLTAAEAGVDVDRLLRRQLTSDDWEKIFRVAPRMQNAHNFVLDDTPNLTVPRIRSRMRWMASTGAAPAIAVVDYLQLLTPDHSNGKDRSRATEVADLSRGLKLLAMEFEIPVVALAQFNRGAVGRQPVPSDFKDSSSIEQDSNIIILLHRPLAEDGTDVGPRAGEVDLIVAKNRNGPSGRIIPLIFQGRYGRLRSMARPA